MGAFENALREIKRMDDAVEKGLAEIERIKEKSDNE